MSLGQRENKAFPNTRPTPQDFAKFAMYLREGLEFARQNDIGETRDEYLRIKDGKIVAACAIGMALLGFVKDTDKALELREKYREPSAWPHQVIAELIDVHPYTTMDASASHYGGLTFEEILRHADRESDVSTSTQAIVPTGCA